MFFVDWRSAREFLRSAVSWASRSGGANFGRDIARSLLYRLVVASRRLCFCLSRAAKSLSPLEWSYLAPENSAGPLESSFGVASGPSFSWVMRDTASSAIYLHLSVR